MNFSIGEIVFALRKNDGFYYPGMVEDVLDTQAKINFDDGLEVLVDLSDIFDLAHTLSKLQIYGNRKGLGTYHPCAHIGDISDPLQVIYEDGAKELIEISKLRVTNVSSSPTAVAEAHDQRKNFYVGCVTLIILSIIVAIIIWMIV